LQKNVRAPLRSWLFAPANAERRVQKALASEAHAVVVDLEDAVPLAEKNEGRAAVRTLLQQAKRPNLFVRVNAVNTPFALDDVAAVVTCSLQGIMLPRSETAHDIAVLDWLITQYEARRSLPAGEIEIVPLVESAAGLSSLATLCAASHRVRRLAFGAADFTLDLGLDWSADEAELRPYQAAIVLASRAAGLDAPIDTPWIHVKDPSGMLDSARRCKANGFQGKLCIHPDQLGSVHQVFSPNSAEIELAERIVAAFEAADSAAVVLDGRMLDYPVVEAARRYGPVAALTS
jgi:citrate lyase subunit beta/citryl-CoA lyase